MEWMREMDEIKASALKELANIGISHVATALGEISREKVDISLPELEPYAKDRILEYINQEAGVAAAYLTVEGIAQLTETLILFPKQEIYELMDRFVNVDAESIIDTLSLSLPEQESIFAEISTIIAATYFSAVDSMFNLKIQYGVPRVRLGREGLGDFIDHVLQQNEGMCVKVSFSSQKSNFKGSFLLLPDPATVNRFFQAIGLAC
ncbi:MAG: chemotaxis protein CheC [Candidatus Omnitrophica bacterium]|nr:chemotaxis protein CheC [Candidatus Omnitrophota bacterium]